MNRNKSACNLRNRVENNAVSMSRNDVKELLDGLCREQQEDLDKRLDLCRIRKIL